MQRQELTQARRLVVKLGTGVLTDAAKQLDAGRMRMLVGQVAAQRAAGREVVVVSSGAVGAGMGSLGFDSRPRQTAELQACAAVGQSRLMALYEQLFREFDLRVAQVLLTHDDLQDHQRHLNARSTLLTLLRHGVIPVINENDAVSTTELRFGDNDRLSALVACLLPADLLILLTTVDGVMENFGKANPRTVAQVERIDESLERLAGGTTNSVAVGGMASKILAAKIVTRAGIPMVIASGTKKRVLAHILDGATEGTLFLAAREKLRGRKRWIAFFHHPRGLLVVDEGAQRALRDRGRSLLPPGILRLEGAFAAGDVVRICGPDGREFARGLAQLSAAALATRPLPRTEVVHRDNLVLL
jgi:glutamate 5-kinase